MSVSVFWGERLSVDEVAAFFDRMPSELTEPLHIKEGVDSSGNHVYLTINDMFKAHYRGCTCRFGKNEADVALIRFKTQFYDNRWIIAQIAKELEILGDLCNFGLYQNEIKTTNSATFQNTHNTNNQQTQTVTNTRNLIDGVLAGSSDAATMGTLRGETLKVIEARKVIEKSENKILDYMDPNVKSLQQTVSISGGSDSSSTNLTHAINGVNNSNNSGQSFTASSNPQQDRLTFINTKIPELRNKFLDVFRCLFYN